jgi:hypothetical protein
VGGGASAELLDCSLGLTVQGSACLASHAVTKVVLRACRVEGRATAAGGEVKAALMATGGASLELETCTVDVGGVIGAVLAEGPGAGAAGLVLRTCVVCLGCLKWRLGCLTLDWEISGLSLVLDRGVGHSPIPPGRRQGAARYM